MDDQVLILAAHQFRCWCGQVVDVQIPVLVSLHQLGPGTLRIDARVDDSEDWEEPAWDHVRQEHSADA